MYHINQSSKKGFDKGQEHIQAQYVETFENVHKLLNQKRIPVIRLLFVYPVNVKKLDLLKEMKHQTNIKTMDTFIQINQDI